MPLETACYWCLVRARSVTCKTWLHCEQCCHCLVCPACSRGVLNDSELCPHCGECAECCISMTCQACEAFIAEGCRACYCCLACCTCYRCLVHEGPALRLCNDCRTATCLECCERQYSLLGQAPFHHYGLSFHEPARAQRASNPVPRMASLEIEVAGQDYHHGLSLETARAMVSYGHPLMRIIDKWHASIVRDGSLPRAGFEINTAPAGGDLLVQQIDDFAKTLVEVGAYVTNACGLHVHVDARDLCYYDIRRLILMYAGMEPALFAMVPESRRHNHYCVPCGPLYKRAVENNRMPKALKRAVLRVAGTGQRTGEFAELGQEGTTATKDDNLRTRLTRDEMKANHYVETRYRALNLATYFYRGTIECRLYPGTVDREEMTNWAMLWANIVQCAATWTDNQADTMRRELTPAELVEACAPTEGVRRWVQDQPPRWY